MSMHEAIRKLRGKVGWLTPGEEEPPIPDPVTPIEEAHALVTLANGPRQIDRESGTWLATSAWAANQIIEAQIALETAKGERVLYLQSRILAMRELLAMDQRELKVADGNKDQAPDIP